MKADLVRKILIAAAIMNFIGVLVFSKAFTNTVLNEADPVVMSNFGLLMIIVWGLAYLSAAFVKSNTTWLVGVFVLVKLIYVVVWSTWILNNNLSVVYEKDIFAGVFYSIYGLNDSVFAMLFAWVFIVQRADRHSYE